MIIKQASDLHFTYVRNTPELREAFINKCKEFGILVWGDDDKIGSYLEVFACPFDCDDKFEIVFTDNLEFQSKELFIGDLIDIPTETPEEKEVLDSIESVGEVGWKDHDELPPVGWRGLTAYTEEGCDDWCDFHDGVVMGVNGDYVWVAHHGKFQRVHHIGSIEFQDVETPQQHEDRERLEAAYDLYCVWVGDRVGHHAIDLNEWKIVPDYYSKWLRIVDKTNYRKEKTHGTN